MSQAEIEEDYTLTPREVEVMDLIAEGKSNKEIAEILGVGKGTIGSFLVKIYDKLDAHNRAGATRMWLLHRTDYEPS